LDGCGLELDAVLARSLVAPPNPNTRQRCNTGQQTPSRKKLTTFSSFEQEASDALYVS